MPGAPNSDINPLATLNATSAAVKGQADPRTIVGVANQAQSIPEATTNIQAIVHSGNMVRMYDSLHGMDITHQASAWGELSSAEQGSLRSLGYNPPNPDVLGHAGAGGGGGGIWGDLMGWGGDAVHGIGHVISDVPHAASDALNALGSPLRAVQHVYRASHVVSEMGVAAAEGWDKAYQETTGSGVSTDTNAFRDIFSPHAWSQAWDETNNGNTQIDPAIHRHLVSQYGQRQVSLAITVANGGPDAAISAAPAAQRTALGQQIQDPKFQQLVTVVTNSRLSVGREAVGEAYLTAHPTEGKILSGGLDAATDIVSDPTLQLGKVAAAYRIARYGATDASRAIDIINNSRPVQRKIAQIAPLLEQGRYGELAKIDPRLDSVAAELSSSNIDSGAKFKDWLVNKNGLKAIFSGDVAKISHQVPVVPHLTYLGWMKAGVKDALSGTVDALSDGKLSDAAHLAPEDIGGAGDHAVLGANDQRFNNLTSLLEAGKVAGGEGRIPGVSNVARLVRRMDTYIPSKAWIKTSDGEADVTNFRRYIQGFLPQHMVDEAANVFVSSNEAKRRLLIASSLKQQAHAAGLYNTAGGSAAADKMFTAIEEEARRQAYSVNGYDTIPDDSGLLQHHALLETQLGAGMRIILPSTMRKIVRANSIWGAAGVDPMNAVDQTMKLWRSLVLDRPGFAVRVSLDENLNRLLREGPKPFVGSFVANGAKRSQTDAEIADQVQRELETGTLTSGQADKRTAALTALSYKPLIPYHPVERALHLLANRAPEGARSNWRSLEEFYGGILGGTTRKWARQAEGKSLKALGLQEYIDGATHLATHQPVADDALQDILASATGSEGFTLTPGSLVKALHAGADGKLAYFKQEGPYSEAAPNDPLFRFKWQVGLDQIARSKLGQAALQSRDYPRNDQIDSVLHVLNSPEFADEKPRFDFSARTRDGRNVGADASQAEADRSFAESVVDHVNAHIREGKYDPAKPGDVIQELVDHMIETGSGPHDELLDTIDNRRIPQAVYGPDMVEVNKFEGFLSRSFEEMTGKPMNWLARQPHLIHQYTHGLRDARELAKTVIPDAEDLKGQADVLANRGKLASDVAFHRAINAVLPYIHNPQLRTQFEDMHRNLMPFLFAQRQFLQRWGRTFTDSPAAIRELQLGMNGLRSTGIVKKDANGNDYFYYPGSQYVTEMITDTLNRIGVHASIPFGVPFTGEVKYLMPGLANPVTPSVGPFAAVGMKELGRVFPEMTNFNQTLLGQGASEGNVQQFLPTVLNRLYESIGPAQAGGQLASAMAMQMKFMDANGQGLPQNATPGQIELYVDRVQKGARDIMLTRTALGFILPATPTAQLDPQGLDARYKELLTLMPYDKAYAQFTKEHPNATAYAIGTTEGATSGNIPSTAQDLQFTNAHTQFAKNYPAAFPWLAPRSPGKFSLSEFLEQEATGQRKPLPVADSTPGAKSVINNIINSHASSEYYAAVDTYDKAYSATTNTAEHRSLTQQYDDWKASFLKRNPTFAAYLTTQAGKGTREATIQNLRQALSDPQLPKDSAAVPGLKAMLESYDTFKATYNQYLGQNTTSAYDTKVSIKNQMVAWGNDYIKSHPEVADFWNTILRPETDGQTG